MALAGMEYFAKNGTAGGPSETAGCLTKIQVKTPSDFFSNFI
jgi:hypothetical protein